MTSERLFWALVVFILGCLVIHLYRKVKDFGSLIQDTSNELFLKRWDDEFKEVVAAYGSGAAFVDAHIKDYDIYRSNVLLFIAKLNRLADSIDTSMKYLSKEAQSDMNRQRLCIKLDAMRNSMVGAVKALSIETTAFVEDEENAHSMEKRVDKVLEKLSKEIKSINFYDEKKD